MAISRILALAVVGVLLIMAALTLQTALKTNAVTANGTNALHDQRAGEWSTGGGYVDGKLDQHDRH